MGKITSYWILIKCKRNKCILIWRHAWRWFPKNSYTKIPLNIFFFSILRRKRRVYIAVSSWKLLFHQCCEKPLHITFKISFRNTRNRFLWAGCHSIHPTESVKALRETWARTVVRWVTYSSARTGPEQGRYTPQALTEQYYKENKYAKHVTVFCRVFESGQIQQWQVIMRMKNQQFSVVFAMHKTLLIDWITYLQNILQPSFVGLQCLCHIRPCTRTLRESYTWWSSAC